MAQVDWFRKTTWSESDAEEFSKRLNRSRTRFHKAQYLLIQASTLSGAGNVSLARPALELLNRLFSEFPEPSELSSAHLQAAYCYEQLCNTAKALEHLQLSLSAQVNYPNRDTGIFLEYPWFVVRHHLADHYAAALTTLRRAHIAFPVTAFKAAAIRALIAEANGEPTAAQHATEALASAALKQSQFQHHRELGLVGQVHMPLVERLRKIATAA
jgi:tetratricopeptide (TPR) repeat protein